MDGIILNTDAALCNESKNVHFLLQANILKMPCLSASWDYFCRNLQVCLSRG